MKQSSFSSGEGMMTLLTRRARRGGLVLVMCLFGLLCLGAAAPAIAGGAISVAPAHGGAITTQASEFRVGQFVRINASDIKAGSTLTIYFDGPGYYVAEMETSNTFDGYAIIALPPYYSISDNALGAREVTLTLDGIGSTSITIAAPMTPPDVDPAEFLALGMEQFAQDSQDLIGSLAQVDTSRASLQGFSDALAYNRDRFNAMAAQARAGSMPQGSGDNLLTLDAAQIATSGRLLYSQMVGLLENAGYSPSSFHTSEHIYAAWWRETRGRLTEAEKANDRIKTLLEGTRSPNSLVSGLAIVLGAQNYLEQAREYAPVVLPTLNWTNQQYAASAQCIDFFMTNQMSRQDLSQLDEHIAALQTLLDQVAALIDKLPREAKDLLDLETWLTKQNEALTVVKVWRKAMGETGDTPGGGIGTPLTDGFWRIDYSYSVQWDATNTHYYDYYYIITLDPNTGNVLNYGRSNDAIGTYSLNGTSITITIDHHYDNPLCCFDSSDDRRVFSGTYLGGTYMDGNWTKDQPGDCGGNWWSGGQCYALPTSTMGWKGTHLGDKWD